MYLGGYVSIRHRPSRLILGIMPNRTSPRHPSFDYRSVAAYFVTTNTHRNRCLLGRVMRGRVHLNDYGRIVAEEWTRSEALRDTIVLDAFVAMPNHVHGIVCIVPSGVSDVSPRGYLLGDSADFNRQTPPTSHVGTTRASSLQDEKQRHPPGPPAQSLSSMIGGFKSAAAKRINRHRGTSGVPVWQPSFHDRILRNEREWRARRRYIERNPGRWFEDRYHPNN